MATIGELLICPKCGRETLEREFRLSDMAGGQRAECAFCGYFYESLDIAGLTWSMNTIQEEAITQEAVTNRLISTHFNIMGAWALRLGFFPRGGRDLIRSSTEGWRLVNRWFSVPTDLGEDTAATKFLTLTKREVETFDARDWFGSYPDVDEAADCFKQESARGLRSPQLAEGSIERDIAEISCLEANEIYQSRPSAPFGQILLLLGHVSSQTMAHSPDCCTHHPNTREITLLEIGWSKD